MSDALALNFALLMAIDWDRKGRPETPGAKLKAYRHNARALLDQSIFEYVTGAWRGSSDSRIAGNVATLRQSKAEAFDRVAVEEWERLVTEMIDQGSIRGVSYVASLDNRAKVLVAYRNVVERHWREPAAKSRPEYDHIIPSSEFSAIPEADPLKALQHNISNLALLPGAVNKAKSDLRLDKVQSLADRKVIELIEGIPAAKFDAFSSGSSAGDLRKFRRSRWIESFTKIRQARVDTANA